MTKKFTKNDLIYIWNELSSSTKTASWLMRGYVVLSLLLIFGWWTVLALKPDQAVSGAFWLYIPTSYSIYLFLDVLQYVLVSAVNEARGLLHKVLNKTMAAVGVVFYIKAAMFSYIVLS